MRWKSAAIALVLCLLGTGVMYALYAKSVPSHIRVVAPGDGGGPPAPTVSLAFYQDEGCTQPTTLVEWGDITQGGSATRSIFWVRNEGNTDITTSGNSTLPSNIGTLTITFKHGPNWQPSLVLPAGSAYETRGIVTISGSASLGDVNFDILVEAT